MPIWHSDAEQLRKKKWSEKGLSSGETSIVPQQKETRESIEKQYDLQAIVREELEAVLAETLTKAEKEKKAKLKDELDDLEHK